MKRIDYLVIVAFIAALYGTVTLGVSASENLKPDVTIRPITQADFQMIEKDGDACPPVPPDTDPVDDGSDNSDDPDGSHSTDGDSSGSDPDGSGSGTDF